MNQSGESIVSGKLEVCGQSFDFKNLASGESKTFSYHVRGDDDFHLEAIFPSGNTIKQRLGYVTSGFDFRDRLIVGRDGAHLDAHDVAR